MKQNVKIAKQLVKLAKRLIASDGGVDYLAKGIYDCIKDGSYTYEFDLPSGASFCITDVVDTEGYYECAIVSDSIYGQPTPNAYWFYNMGDINSIHEDDSLQDCKNIAQQIFDLDKNYKFDISDKEYILDYINNLYEKDMNKQFESYNDDYTIIGQKWYVYTWEVFECIEKHFDKYVQFLNARWNRHGVSCFKNAMCDMYDEYLATPIQKYNLKQNEYDDFETACESLANGYGFKASDYMSTETRAKQIYNYALDFMGNYD